MEIFRRAPDAGQVIAALNRVFDNQGVPQSCQADNGPPFNAKELHRFARRQGFMLRHITPEWPRANGEVERFNRTMKEAVQKGTLENKSIREAASVFMRRYRATPHTVTGVSPFEAMYQRRMKIDLPIRAAKGEIIDQTRVEEAQKKMKRRKGKDHDWTLAIQCSQDRKSETSSPPLITRNHWRLQV